LAALLKLSRRLRDFAECGGRPSEAPGQELERILLVAPLALLGYPMPDAVVDAQGSVQYIFGGLAQETF
jgi:hypothetical protein